MQFHSLAVFRYIFFSFFCFETLASHNFGLFTLLVEFLDELGISLESTVSGRWYTDRG